VAGRELRASEWADAPIEPALTPEGKPCVTAVPSATAPCSSPWRVRIGRVTLTARHRSEENAPWDRELGAFTRDRETRVQQEIVLASGGVRTLKALGANPAVFHLNEGHAAFVVLQRIRDLTEQGATFDEALEQIRRTTIFTTHTPVAAGHDAFPFHLVEKHLAGCWGTLGPNRDRFLALGAHDSGAGPQFNMTALALRSASAVNAVSRLHGEVTRAMWGDIWPGVPEAERPVGYVTNGVHVPTWIAGELRQSVLEAYLGVGWMDRHDDPSLWGRHSSSIPDQELWAVRQSLRKYLFTFIRERARQRWTEERVGIPRVVAAGTLLEPDALTIGFARRFAGYKRPELVFHDPDRLARILNATGRPVQIVFAGKSHPADDVGKHHLQRVYKRALDPMFAGRVAFVDDYDLHVAHFLVQGCDVWLNNPSASRLEASGTSGMKAALNVASRT
jgi:starch phosphorylase